MVQEKACALIVLLLTANLAEPKGLSDFDPEKLLALAVARLNESNRILPRFACSATIDREMYGVRLPLDQKRRDPSPEALEALKERRILSSQDRLKVEVALFEGRQLFSWPTQSVFEHEGVDELVGEGTSASGEFGPFLSNIFLSEATPSAFRFAGVLQSRGVRCAVYTYKIPLGESHFWIQNSDKRRVLTEFDGSFLINIDTSQLVRLIVRLPKPPSDSDISLGLIVIDYAQYKEGERAAVLPLTSTVTLLLSESQAISVNQTKYDGCRVFSSQSALRFDSNADAAAPKSAQSREPAEQLPPGLCIRSKLITPLGSGTSYAGDRVEAIIVEPVRKERATLAPKGAKVIGRVVQARQQYFPVRKAKLMVEFLALEYEGVSTPVSLASAGPAGAVCSEASAVTQKRPIVVTAKAANRK
jgi:hypothetical protein